MKDKCELLVNSSRGIIYASNDSDFAEKADEAAKIVQQKMEELLKDASLI
jgi:orotidine-5'-phosphate decarboxylase